MTSGLSLSFSAVRIVVGIVSRSEEKEKVKVCLELIWLGLTVYVYNEKPSNNYIFTIWYCVL